MHDHAVGLGGGADRGVGDHMPIEVAVEDPRAGPVRVPGEAHRGAFVHQFRHRHALLRRPVERVAVRVAAGGDPVVEPVQVQRVHVRRRIDEAPADGSPCA